MPARPADSHMLDAVLAASPDYTFVTDLDTGELVYGSPGKTVLGLTLAEMRDLRAALPDLVHPDDRDVLAGAKEREVLLADGQQTTATYRARHRDGSWRWLTRTSTPFLRDEGGRVTAILGVVRDVTDEQANAAALRESEAQLRALISHVVDYAIIGLDAGGKISAWNTGAERMKGYTSQEALGQNFAIFFPEADRAHGLPEKVLAQARTEGRAEHVGLRVRKDGSTFWGDVAITAMLAEDGTVSGFAEVTRDLSEQRRIDQARASFAATITHDLKTPLTAIKLFAELIEGEDPAGRADFARRIITRVDHLTGLVDDLLEYGKTFAPEYSLDMVGVSLTDVLARCVDNVSGIVGHRRIDIAPTTLHVVADAHSAERVLTNLLSNAIKYSPDGSTVTVSSRQVDDRALVEVHDHGRGIAEEDLSIVFDEFERGRLAGPDGGSGLGLTSARRLMDLQGGTLSLTSVVGEGTTATADFCAL